MIFQHTYKWIAEASPHTRTLKTQTRRLAKPSDYWHEGTVYTNTLCKHKRWATGNTYAVQAGRGLPALWTRTLSDGTLLYETEIAWSNGALFTPLRIRVRDIRYTDVRTISDEDALAEGFASRESFLGTWVSMHDKKLFISSARMGGFSFSEKLALEEILATRPAERYQAWVIKFELGLPEADIEGNCIDWGVDDATD